MTDGLDWRAAEEALYEVSKEQFIRLLGRADRGEVYGLGFFCDPIEGVMPVANTRPFHEVGFRHYVEGGGTTDEKTFRWDIGNWEYPAGLASSTEGQMEFDARWGEFGRALSASEDDRTRALLEGLCVRVLRRLSEEGLFSGARGIEAFIVLGPDDPAEGVLKRLVRLGDLLKGPGL